MKKKNFPKGSITINIPFIPDIGSFEQLYKKLETIKPPKGTRRKVKQVINLVK